MSTRLTCAILILLSLTGCDSEDRPPEDSSQLSSQHEAARSDLRHLGRLREIERLRFQSDLAELSGQLQILRGMSIALAICLLAALLWLALEIRRRRIMTAIARSIPDLRHGHQQDAPDDHDATLFVHADPDDYFPELAITD